MRLSVTFRIAIHALSRNVSRAALTALGIIIGVAAVIVMMEIGNGSSKAIQQSIASMGANNLIIMPGTAASSGVSFGAGTSMTLTPDDAEALNKEVPMLKGIAVIVRARTQVVYANRNWVPMYIYGTTPSFLKVRDWEELQSGEMFTDQDLRNGSKVCVIGKTIVRELFQSESPIGKEIRIQNVSFRVVGVLTPKGANMMGMDQDDIILAPWTTIKYRVVGSSAGTQNQSAGSSSDSSGNKKLYPGGSANLYPTPSASQALDNPLPVRFANVDQIMVSTHSSQDIESAIRSMTDVLRERHRIKPGEVEDFSIRDLSEITKTLSSATSLMTKLLLSVALISLVVGGVGIMNIMLVSVTERTREIGLRMAVGARARDILEQFLVEAVVLCLGGGVLGILLGRGCSYLVTVSLHWPIEASLGAVMAAFFVSVSVGIVFGYYPAWKASRLDPIEALRYE